MKRRNLLFSIGSAVVLGGTGIYGYLNFEESPQQATGETQTEFVDESDVPEDVQQLQSLAYKFNTHISEFYPDADVFIAEGEIVTIIDTDESSAEGVKSELTRVAKEFATVFADSESDVAAPTFSAITHQVQAIVAPAVLDSYRAGELKQSAVVETIEITEANRTSGGHDHGSHDHGR